MRHPSEERLIHSSPQRVNKTVRQELREQGHLNNVIAFGVQEKLHELLNHPDYYAIRPIMRGNLRRMQGLAFDGYYTQEADRMELLEQAENMQHPRNTNGVYAKLKRTLEEIEGMIQKNETHWKQTGYQGDMLRMHQDLDAVETFASRFRGRLLFYGSARKGPGNPVYDGTRWISQTLVEGMADEEGNTELVLTGGGPGVMAAGNEGAMQARANLLKKIGALNSNGRTKKLSPSMQRVADNLRYSLISLGIRIDLPFEQGWNDYLQGNLTIKAFPARKLGMQMAGTGRCFADTTGTIVNHGRHPALFSMIPGFGTADENWEALCAMQCGKMPPIPFITVGKGAGSIMEKTLDVMEENGTIDPRDRELVIMARNEVHALERYLEKYGITPNAFLKKAIAARKPVIE